MENGGNNMNVLVINAGSSSLKYQLLNPATGALLAKGLCERIGIDGKFTYKPQLEGKEAIKAADVAMPTHNEAIAAVLNALVDEKNGVIGSMKEIDAVGHRVVHGGEKFAKSVVITDEVMAAIEECNPLAPLHNPANIIGIKACQQLMPGVPMVAVFDTAFHQTMPPVAYTYAIPYEYYENDKVRRYGFHGTSHKYVASRAADMLGKPIESLKLISCHLGNGSSVTAVDGGKSVETSMGFTPLAGLPMGTRAGDIDAGILEYLMNKYGYSIGEMLNILNKSPVWRASPAFPPTSAIWRRALRGATSAARSPARSSPTRSRSSSARMPPSWAAWTPSSSPPVSARTTRSSVCRSRPAWVHGREDGRGRQQRPRRGARDLRHGFQGQGPAHPHQRRADDRHGYRLPRRLRQKQAE